MESYVFALLPLGLLSLFDRGRHRATAGLGFLAALAPVLAKGAMSLIGHKQKKSSQKQAEEARRLEAQRADEMARQQWEADVNAPSAQSARFKQQFALGRLAGKLGGIDKVPPSIAKYYRSMSAMPEYKGTPSYIPTPKKGGGGWDFAAGVADALGYLDTSKFGGGGKPPMGQTPNFAPSQPQIMSSNVMPGSSALDPLIQRIRRQPSGGLANPKMGG